VLGSKRYNLIPLAQKKWISLDYEHSAMLPIDGAKGFVEIIQSVPSISSHRRPAASPRRAPVSNKKRMTAGKGPSSADAAHILSGVEYFLRHRGCLVS
jgi:hypothetical protein